MPEQVSDFLVRRLSEWGVRKIFGLPGDGINGLLGALDRAGTIDFILAPHEELAALMATAHAKLTGELSVCLATSGPGALHLLTGLYDARLDRAPVLALVGQQPTFGLGGSEQQEVNLSAVMQDVAQA
ncbi:MAG TPA: thiamine pyrophosphate-binding protein, partial [Deinococcales bacterium]|nr:thiamine pyrophosphate-binding protein [Deinococcales bacterium]